MFDIGGTEFLALGVIALVVFGPDKLPKYAAEAARFLRDVRKLANSAREDVRRELGPELRDLDLSDLNPRTFVKRHVLDELDDDPPRPVPRQQSPAGGTPSASPGPAPYDPDAT
ncbi:MAG TPA: sec-independent translocase [Actinomycetes bacterium]